MGKPSSLWAFAGRWSLERRITDAKAGEMRLQGLAEFRPSTHRLLYREEGQLRLPGRAPIRAVQQYIWEVQRGWIAIRFADGRPFHGFPLGVVQPEATYLRPPDRYAVAYDFRDWPRWRAEWVVSGPRKDYRMVSEYRRVHKRPCAKHDAGAETRKRIF